MLTHASNFLHEAMKSVCRRELLKRAARHNPCPKCKSPQVELIGSMKVGRWKCRSCKHKWVWEPIKLIRSDSN